MKKRGSHGLSDRQESILKAVVKEYVLTAEPVGSRALSEHYRLEAGGLSSASVRGVVAELESMGLVSQPHTSAGRVPTDMGFRVYVDSLLDTDEPHECDKALLKESCRIDSDVERLFAGTSRALARLTGCAGIVFMPAAARFVIRHLRLLPMDPNRVIFIMVSTLGIVKRRLVAIDADLSRLDLDGVSDYLNSIGSGLTLKQLRARIVEEMGREKVRYDGLLAEAFRLAAAALDQEREAAVGLYVEGKTGMFEHPEFRRNFDLMRKTFEAFEEKSILARLLDIAADESEGAHVHFGSEEGLKGLDGLSIVTAPYGGGSASGALGVVGPVRMNYSKVVPLVEYAAQLLGEAL